MNSRDFLYYLDFRISRMSNFAKRKKVFVVLDLTQQWYVLDYKKHNGKVSFCHVHSHENFTKMFSDNLIYQIDGYFVI